MFVRRILGALLASSLAMSAMADNTLILPEKSKLLVLDGKGTDSIKDSQKLTLKDGRHQVVFQLKTLVREGGDTNMFSSTPYIMTFDLSGDQTYTIEGPSLKTSRDVKQLENAPENSFKLLSDSGKKEPYKFSVLNKPGILIGADTVEDIQKLNLSDNPAAVREFAGAVYIATAQGISYQFAPQHPAVQVMPAPVVAPPMSETMLQYWYNQADEATRTRFMKWVSEANAAAQ